MAVAAAPATATPAHGASRLSAGDAAALSNSGALGSGASTWTPALRDGSGHGARGKEQRRSDGTAQR
jgi:hypothetical protein